MPGLIAVLLLPMCFTAPADSLGVDRTGAAQLSPSPVRAYQFQRLDERGRLAFLPGYADSLGRTLLRPHRPGTRETVWLAPGDDGERTRIFVRSLDGRGNLSARSNGAYLGAAVADAQEPVDPASVWTTLSVPVLRQARERCGQSALTMVLRYYGAPDSAVREVDAAYDPVLRGSLITDLAGAAERAGFQASIATLTPEMLIELLASGVPPILLYQNGSGPVTYPHFGVVTGWDPERAAFTLHDGTAHPVVTRRDELEKRWTTAGSQALVVRQRLP